MQSTDNVYVVTINYVESLVPIYIYIYIFLILESTPKVMAATFVTTMSAPPREATVLHSLHASQAPHHSGSG
jgi:hypothetical protein